jgi:hypothetical protein
MSRSSDTNAKHKRKQIHQVIKIQISFEPPNDEMTIIIIKHV